MVGRYQAYPEYKASGVEWLGTVPAHWKTSCLRWYINIASGEGLSNTEFDKLPDETNIFPVIGGNGTLGYSAYLNTISKVFAIGRVGALCGNVHFINEKCWITDNALKLSAWRAFQDGYLFFLLTAARLNEYASKNAQPLITGEQVKALQVVMPSIDEQQQIANFLNNETAKIDTLIEKQQQLIKLLKEKRQAVISHAVTKGLNPDAPMRESGIAWLGEVPEHWGVMQLRRITRLQQGLQIPQENRFAEDGENRVEYITIKSINAGSDRAHKEFIESPSTRVVCIQTDVLLARTGATGEVITNVAGVFHNNFFKVNYDQNRITKDYLVYFLKVNQVKNHLLMLAGTTTIPDLNHGAFLGTLICLPCLNEQEQICKYLDEELKKFDHICGQAYKIVNLLQERRTALISAAVTGKIDVRNWQDPEQKQTKKEDDT